VFGGYVAVTLIRWMRPILIERYWSKLLKGDLRRMKKTKIYRYIGSIPVYKIVKWGVNEHKP
jgi:hypothetical protein